MINYPRWIYIPKIEPAKGFWINLDTVRLVGDLTEKEVIIKIWFTNGESLLLCREQANSFIEQMMQRLPEIPTPETAPV